MRLPMSTRVLIVDDRPTNLRIYAQFVTLMGDKYSAVTFADPVEALEWLSDNDVELMVVDYRMPQMNGAEFIRKVRKMHNAGEVLSLIHI